jgi:hypothetical protein
MLTDTVLARRHGSFRPVRQQRHATHLKDIRLSRFTTIHSLWKNVCQRHSGATQSCRTNNERVAYTNAYACFNVYTLLLPVMERFGFESSCRY